MVVVAAELIAVTVRLGENVVVVMSVQFEITSIDSPGKLTEKSVFIVPR